MSCFFRFFILLLVCVAAPTLAEARGHTGDLFGDMDWLTYNRPHVPSDTGRPDLFASLPPLYNEGADLFEHLRPTRISIGADMLAPRPVPYPTGKLFHSWEDGTRND